MAELEGVLFAGELEVAADEDEHGGVDAWGLRIDGGDGVLALLEGKELGTRKHVLWSQLEIVSTFLKYLEILDQLPFSRIIIYKKYTFVLFFLFLCSNIH